MTALALAVIATALLIALTAIAIGVLDRDQAPPADTDWDSHVAEVLDLIRTEETTR